MKAPFKCSLYYIGAVTLCGLICAAAAAPLVALTAGVFVAYSGKP